MSVTFGLGSLPMARNNKRTSFRSESKLNTKQDKYNSQENIFPVNFRVVLDLNFCQQAMDVAFEQLKMYKHITETSIFCYFYQRFGNYSNHFWETIFMKRKWKCHCLLTIYQTCLVNSYSKLWRFFAPVRNTCCNRSALIVFKREVVKTCNPTIANDPTFLTNSWFTVSLFTPAIFPILKRRGTKGSF